MLTERNNGHTEHPRRDGGGGALYQVHRQERDKCFSEIRLALKEPLCISNINQMYNIYLYDHIWYFTTSILEDTTVLGDKVWYNSENLYTASVFSKISFQL